MLSAIIAALWAIKASIWLVVRFSGIVCPFIPAPSRLLGGNSPPERRVTVYQLRVPVALVAFGAGAGSVATGGVAAGVVPVPFVARREPLRRLGASLST